MTSAELIALAKASLTTDVPTAGRAFDLGTNASYDLVKRGEFPVPVLRLGRRLRISTSSLLEALGIKLDESAA